MGGVFSGLGEKRRCERLALKKIEDIKNVFTGKMKETPENFRDLEIHTAPPPAGNNGGGGGSGMENGCCH